MNRMYVILLLAVNSCYGRLICDLIFSSCPYDNAGKVIEIPEDIISIFPKVSSCHWNEFLEDVTSETRPPSIMFIIDHSYSMMGLGNTYPGNDVFGARFKVARDIIDTIYSMHKNAEIGLVVFREKLYFDHKNNPLFVPLPGQGDESFLPLLQLNKNYGDMSGIEAIKTVLETDTVTRKNVIRPDNINVTCVDLVYQPLFTTIGNTNINSAFTAALEAMKSARYAKDQQFIIFLSDGEAFPTDNPAEHGGKNPFFFVGGEKTPTTFTIYLHNTETGAPLSIQTMTENIKNNGYSGSNSLSNVWTMKTDYTALMSLFMTQIIKPFFYNIQSKPVSMKINNVRSTAIEENKFVYEKRFSLNKDTTTISMGYTFDVKDSVKNFTYDSTIQFSFDVVRKKGASLIEGVEKVCYNGPELFVYYNGARVYAVNDAMKQLEIRLYENEMRYRYVNVIVANASVKQNDMIKLEMDNKGKYWSERFERVIAPPQKDDLVLQHTQPDSIIVIFKNPDILLDTLRIALPFDTLVHPIEEKRYKLVVYTVNNPMTPDKKIPQSVQSFYHAKNGDIPQIGSIITVVPEGDIPENLALYGTVSIYDVAKNVIVRDAEMMVHENRLYYIWDGKNIAKRKVATGTYLAIVDIQANNIKKSLHKLYLGVKR